MACCSLVHPFKWQHALIPILPVSLKEVLDAPFPFIIGMKKSHKEKWHLLDISNSSLIVLLDKGEIFQTEESMISVFPALINSGNNIKNNYKEFSKRFYEVESHEINYTPTSKQITASEIICSEIENIVRENILGKLPDSKEFKTDTINLNEIQRLIRENLNDENKEFVGKFIDSQMFAVYIEDHYSYLK